MEGSIQATERPAAEGALALPLAVSEWARDHKGSFGGYGGERLARPSRREAAVTERVGEKEPKATTKELYFKVLLNYSYNFYNLT